MSMPAKYLLHTFFALAFFLLRTNSKQIVIAGNGIVVTNEQIYCKTNKHRTLFPFLINLFQLIKIFKTKLRSVGDEKEVISFREIYISSLKF